MPPFRPTSRLLWSMPHIFKHVSPRNHPQLVQVQRVRFLKPKRTGRVVWTISAMVICWHVYYGVVLGPLYQAAAKQLENMSPQEIKEMDDSPPIFVPFPFTTRLVPAAPYSGRDPEWIAYIDISKDPELLSKIRHQLAGICLASAKRHGDIVRQLGPDIEIDRYWLDITFPLYPPPEFKRKGLELNNEGLAWVEKPVPRATVLRTERTLWPTPVAASIWTFSWSLFKQHIQDTARILGISTKPSDPVAGQVLAQAAETMARREQPKKTPPRIQEPGSMSSSSKTASGPVTDNPSKPIPLSEDSREEDDRLKPQDLYPYDSMRQHIQGAWSDLLNSLRQRWTRTPNFPPRGYVFVSGLVQLKTEKGWLLLDCRGYWDPKISEYEFDNMLLLVRSLKYKTQGPLR